MSESRRGLVLRLAAEFVIIVAGVLAALAVDEWRDSQQERELEAELLEAFVRDLTTDSVDYARMPARSMPRLRAAELLRRRFTPAIPARSDVLPVLDTLGPWPDRIPNDSLPRLLQALRPLSNVDAATGAYRDFADGGAHRLIRNVELRNRIHDYYYELDGISELDDALYDLLQRYGAEANRLGIDPGDPDGDRMARILSSPEAETLLAISRSLMMWTWAQSSETESLAEAATALRAAIRTELRSVPAR